MPVSPQFTIIIPTHNHGELLPYAVESLRKQKLKRWEAYIIGDGATETVVLVAKALEKKDNRIKFLSHKKSARVGELYRDEVLRSAAKGRFIAYLADDDLWLPNHLDLLSKKLLVCDFVAAKAIIVKEDGTLTALPGAIAQQSDRKRMLAGDNFLMTSCGAHTLAAYLKLPVGWRKTPVGVFPDCYMWQQWCRELWPRFGDLEEFTVVNLPSARRKSWSSGMRVKEIVLWSKRIQNEGEWRKVLARFSLDFFREYSELYRQWHVLHNKPGSVLKETQRNLHLAEQELNRYRDSKLVRLYRWMKQMTSSDWRE